MNQLAACNDRLRVKEAKELARVSTAQIYLWLHEGRFGTWVVKRRGYERGVRFIDRPSFEAFLQSQRQNMAYGMKPVEEVTA
jgi:hypothetical protein